MIKERDLELRFVHGRPEEGEKGGIFSTLEFGNILLNVLFILVFTKNGYESIKLKT